MNAAIAGVSGSLAQGLLMFVKRWLDILPGFQPYSMMQQRLGEMTGDLMTPYLIPLLGFVNGALVLSYLFGKLYDKIPSEHGLMKGMLFGTFGWLLFNLSLFPMLGYGFFVSNLHLGALPSIFSFVMIQSYSLVLAFAYAKLMHRNL